MGNNFIGNMRNDYRKKEIFFGLMLLLNDIFFLGLAFFLSFISRFGISPVNIFRDNIKYYIYYSIIGLLIIIILLYFRKLYSYKNLYFGMGNNESIIISVIITIFLIIVFNYYFHREIYQLSRIWIMYSTVISIVLLMMSRAVTRRVVLWFFRKKEVNINILVIGANEEGKRIVSTFRKRGAEAINIVGFLDKRHQIERIKKTNDFKDLNILGDLDKLEIIIKKFNVNRIIVSSHNIKYFDILHILDRVGDLNVEVQMSPSLFEFSVSRMKIFEYMGIPLIQIQKITIKGIDRLLKFLIDYSLGIVLFAVFMLIYPVLAVIIKIDSKGSVLYSQERYGKDFKKIRVYKFRTMRAEADREKKYIKKIYNRKGSFKIKNDPRITRVGRFLRKTSIDELPQVINVMKGNLCVVGPRALATEEGDLLDDWEKKRMQVNQGITGLWQVSGRSDISYEERIKLDLYYIQNWSIWLELKIIALTIIKMFKGSGAY
jgi:exopolysaccharide biosynthesis polyprenyl glycosylphosphotransferase